MSDQERVVLEFFAQYNRQQPGSKTIVEVAVDATGLAAPVVYTAVQALGDQGLVEHDSTNSIIHGQTLVLITPAGQRAIGLTSDEEKARDAVLRYVADHSAQSPAHLDTAARELGIDRLVLENAILSLAQEGLLHHEQEGGGLGRATLTAAGRNAIA